MAVDEITARAHDTSNDGSTPGGGGESDRLGPGVWKIIAVTVAGAFMAQLSTTMVNVSLSSLGAELHANLSAIQWVTSGYLLALALMLPLSGGRAHRGKGALSVVLLRFHALRGFLATGPARLGRPFASVLTGRFRP
jgi:MFS family permease